MSVSAQSQDAEWQTMKMRVGAEILKNLSRGIYSNPANTIKELINNSYDANATEVIVRARPEFDTITITDNGAGMNKEEFKEDFTFISRSRKRDSGLYTEKLNRPKIGKIGIGFISALQICDEMVLISKKAGENHKLEAHIDFGKFKGEMAKESEFQDISEVKYCTFPEEEKEHYTMIIMTKLSKEFVEILEDKELEGIDIIDFKEKNFEEIIDQIDNLVKRGKIEDFYKEKKGKAIGQYWNMLLQIANAVPVKYLDDGPIKNCDWEIINQLKENVKSLRFDVEFDGVHLRKPLRFPNVPEISEPGKDYDVFTFKENFGFDDGSELDFSGYIYNQRQRILPTQFRGIIIRIKNVTIGDFFEDFLDYRYHEKLYLPWTTGEIYIHDGLEEAMNIDRNTFDITHPHYRKLRTYLHKMLHETVFKRTRKRYTSRIEERRKNELASKEQALQELLRKTFGKTFTINYPKKRSPQNPIEIDLDEKIIRIYKFHPVFSKPKKERKILEDLLIRFEIAYSLSEGDINNLRKYFFDELGR